LLQEAVFFEPGTGREIKRLKLPHTNNASVALSPERIFQAGLAARLSCVSLKTGLQEWQVSTPALLKLAPLYDAPRDLVVFADTGNTVAAITPRKSRRFVQTLDGAVQGGLASDDQAVYVAASDLMVYAIGFDEGEVIWRYRLAAPPDGGPVVTRKSLYQAVGEAGLHRIGLGPSPSPATHEPRTKSPAAGGAEAAPTTAPSPDLARRMPNWRDPQAKCFLAEWSGRVAVLHRDHRIALIDPWTGQVSEYLEPGPAEAGLSNPYNDAIILTTPGGHLSCIRPATTKPLTLADFRRPTSERVVAAPSNEPAKSEPAAPSAEAPEAAGTPAATGEQPPTPPAAPVPVKTWEQTVLADPLRSDRRIRH